MFVTAYEEVLKKLCESGLPQEAGEWGHADIRLAEAESCSL